MRKFLIQKENDYLFDFCNQTIEAIHYLNWFNQEQIYDYKIISIKEIINDFNNTYKEYIPIGSIEFVLMYYRKYHNIENITPICIPNELNKKEYLLREIRRGSKANELNLDNPVFMKNILEFKKETIIDYMKEDFKKDKFLVSELIEIDSEWRGFVLNGKLLDLRCYSGEFSAFPNINVVYDMIKAYTEALRAYTIDVAVTKNGTALLEIHQFFSCGLYGFNQNQKLIAMYVQNHIDIIKK